MTEPNILPLAHARRGNDRITSFLFNSYCRVNADSLIIACNGTNYKHMYNVMDPGVISYHTVQQESLASIKFGKLALRRYWQNLNLVIWILSVIGTHAIIYIGKFLIWRPLPNSPNRQIKNLAKVSRYTVLHSCGHYNGESNFMTISNLSFQQVLIRSHHSLFIA